MSKETGCTLTNEELITRCNDWVSKLAKTGGRAWSLRVPVDFNNDPDMLFIELARRFETVVKDVEDASLLSQPSLPVDKASIASPDNLV